MNNHEFHSYCFVVYRPPFNRACSAFLSLVSVLLKSWWFRIFVQSWPLVVFDIFVMFQVMVLLFSGAQLASNTCFSEWLQICVFIWIYSTNCRRSLGNPLVCCFALFVLTLQLNLRPRLPPTFLQLFGLLEFRISVCLNVRMSKRPKVGWVQFLCSLCPNCQIELPMQPRTISPKACRRNKHPESPIQASPFRTPMSIHHLTPMILDIYKYIFAFSLEFTIIYENNLLPKTRTWKKAATKA